MTVPGLKVKSTAPLNFQPVMSRANGVGLVTQTYSWAWLAEDGLASSAKTLMKAFPGCVKGIPALKLLPKPIAFAVFVMQCVANQCVRRGLMYSFIRPGTPKSTLVGQAVPQQYMPQDPLVHGKGHFCRSRNISVQAIFVM